MADLLVKAGGRQDAYSDVRTVPRKIVGLTALGEIGGDAPVVRVDPLGMAGPAQRLQPADMERTKASGSPPIRSMAVRARSRCWDGR